MYADKWGWTPQQVDDLTLEQEDWLLPIAEALDSERQYRMEKEQRAAERKAKSKGKGH